MCGTLSQPTTDCLCWILTQPVVDTAPEEVDAAPYHARAVGRAAKFRETEVAVLIALRVPVALRVGGEEAVDVEVVHANLAV